MCLKDSCTDHLYVNSSLRSTLNKDALFRLLALVFLNVIPGLVAHAIVLTIMRKFFNQKLCLAKRLLLVMCVADIAGIVVVFFKHLLNVIIPKPCFSLCAVAAISISFVALLSAILATAMGLERCIALRAPYWYKCNFDSWKMSLPIGLVILLAFLISILPITPLGTVFEIRTNATLDDMVCSSFPAQRITVGLRGVFPIVFAAFGGLVIMLNVASNGLVIKTLRNMRLRVKNLSFDTRSQNKLLIEHELTRMLFLLSVCFIVCWGPMYMLLLLIQMGYAVHDSVLSASYALAGFNFAIDPLIYMIMMKTYRKRMRTLCCCCYPVTVAVDGAADVNTTPL